MRVLLRTRSANCSITRIINNACLSSGFKKVEGDFGKDICFTNHFELRAAVLRNLGKYLIGSIGLPSSVLPQVAYESTMQQLLLQSVW